MMIVLIGVIGVLFLILHTGGSSFPHIPHILQSGKLTTFMGALTVYSQDHNGWYPNGGTDALNSLQKLYPKYATAELSGMSGKEQKVVGCLQAGGVLDTNMSSWVYFPGFRNDDNPEIAIIWERQEGIFVNGGKVDGYAVGFVGGGYDQIPSKDWLSFTARQADLRAKVLEERGKKTEAVEPAEKPK